MRPEEPRMRASRYLEMIDLMCTLAACLFPSPSVCVLAIWCLSCAGDKKERASEGESERVKEASDSKHDRHLVATYIAQWLEMVRYHEVTSDQH